jgi:hypothetical protein
VEAGELRDFKVSKTVLKRKKATNQPNKQTRKPKAVFGISKAASCVLLP